MKRTMAWPGHNHHRERPLPFRGHPQRDSYLPFVGDGRGSRNGINSNASGFQEILLFGNLGQCDVVAGVRRGSLTIVQQDGF